MAFKSFFATSLLAIVVGFLGGTVATVLTQDYLERYVQSLEEAAFWQQRLSEERPKPVPGSVEESLALVHEELLPSLVVFYTGGRSATLLPGSEVGFGVVVTSDGWVLTTTSAIGSRAFVNGVEYELGETLEDPLTEVALVKMEATGLPVVAFGDSASLVSGELLFAGTGVDTLLATELRDPSFWQLSSVAANAEIFSGSFSYSDELTLAGSPVVNARAELVAIGETPLHFFEGAMTNAVRSSSFSRAFLGVQIMDLSFVRPDVTTSRGFTRGALVTSVTAAAPARTAGIHVGDILLRVQDRSLDRETTLAEILAELEAGKSVSILLDRDGQQATLEVELGQL